MEGGEEEIGVDGGPEFGLEGPEADGDGVVAPEAAEAFGSAQGGLVEDWRGGAGEGGLGGDVSGPAFGQLAVEAGGGGGALVLLDG